MPGEADGICVMLVMTYNIRAGLGIDDNRSLLRVADVIRAAGASVVCLQEVDRKMPRSGLTDQAKWLGERLGMESVFQPNLAVGPAGFGNAVLSRYPVLSAKSHSLTSNDEQRGLMEVMVAAPDINLTVFCTHFGLDAGERLVQAGESAAFVREAHSPAIFCGDLNEIETGTAVQRLLTESGLHDLAKDAAEPENTYPVDNLQARIDYILGTPDMKGTAATALDSPASDHRPVLVEIESISMAR